MNKEKAINILRNIAECVQYEEDGDSVHITEYVGCKTMEELIDFFEKNL